MNPCSFSSGSLGSSLGYIELIDNLKYLHLSLYSVHANFINGSIKKARALMKYGFWLWDKKNSLCSNYTFFEPSPEFRSRSVITKASTV